MPLPQRKKAPKGALNAKLKDRAAFEPKSPIISEYIPKNLLVDRCKKHNEKVNFANFFYNFFLSSHKKVISHVLNP